MLSVASTTVFFMVFLLSFLLFFMVPQSFNQSCISLLFAHPQPLHSWKENKDRQSCLAVKSCSHNESSAFQ